jgi:hypothetical protein
MTKKIENVGKPRVRDLVITAVMRDGKERQFAISVPAGMRGEELAYHASQGVLAVLRQGAIPFMDGHHVTIVPLTEVVSVGFDLPQIELVV